MAAIAKKLQAKGSLPELTEKVKKMVPQSEAYVGGEDEETHAAEESNAAGIEVLMLLEARRSI